MTTTKEFLDWVCGLPSPEVPVHGHTKQGSTISLLRLVKDLHRHPDFLSWWKGLNMPRHLNNTVALTILDLNPPENIRAAMLFLMM